MNLLMGLSKMSDNLVELERRMVALQKLDAGVGNTKGNMTHPNFEEGYNSLFWLQHSGSTKAKIPPRPISTISAMTFKGEDLIRKGLTSYFKDLDKKSTVSAEDALMPFLKGLYEYSYDIFGDNTFLKPNAEYTIKLKNGRDTPLIDSGDLRAAWGILIDGKGVN